MTLSEERRRSRRRKMMLRVGPVVVLAVIAFAAGVVVASGSAEVDAAERFADAWAAEDYGAMYAELNADAQAATSQEDFEAAYDEGRETSTLTDLTVGEARGPLSQDGQEVVAVGIDANTESFGAISGEVAIPVADGGVAWAENLVFPGLQAGQTLERNTKPPTRAPILAADGSALAEGPVDARVTNGAGGIVTGEIGEPSPERAEELVADGFAEGTLAGTSGLELAFDKQLAGTPGGKLFAVSDGDRAVIAKSKPLQGKPVKTTIDPGIQQLASDALGAQFGGVAVVDAKNGDIKALAGIAFSAPQPPGSTMKIVTTAAALDDGTVDVDSTYDAVSTTVVGGREIRNSNEEICGGNLVESFAKSCNTVFAPIGVDIGGKRLVEASEDFGFNSPPALYDEEALDLTKPPESTIPTDLENEIDVGVSAIGQGQVLATPLQMASVAQTIANNGTRSPTSLVKDKALKSDAKPVEVVSPETADKMRKMMIEVVESGTGIAAAVPQGQVAGKTGTAELGPDPNADVDPENPEDVKQLVDAWFAAFAPADDPELALAVMIVEAEGDGGTIAAPIASQIFSGALE
jgi:peptidoglycan glycosyltransferase